MCFSDLSGTYDLSRKFPPGLTTLLRLLTIVTAKTKTNYLNDSKLTKTIFVHNQSTLLSTWVTQT